MLGGIRPGIVKDPDQNLVMLEGIEVTMGQSSADWNQDGMWRCSRSWYKVGSCVDALAGVATHVCHELFADGADVLGEGCREHHHLLVMWRHLKNCLYIGAHVCKKQYDSAQE